VSSPEPIKTWSHHEVCTWAESKKAEGTFKRCGHLSVVSVVRGEAVHTIFIPNCAKRSFHWKDGEPPPSRLWERETLKDCLHQDIISCPPNCVDYLSEWKARFHRAGSQIWKLGKQLAVPFQWFAKLPWQTQFLITALLILALVPRWVPPLIALLKALRGT